MTLEIPNVEPKLYNDGRIPTALQERSIATLGTDIEITTDQARELPSPLAPATICSVVEHESHEPKSSYHTLSYSITNPFQFGQNIQFHENVVEPLVSCENHTRFANILRIY